ncbi:HNH endonuclease signature motif containing protein [Streptomyces caniscabiei]|uniref:HNH endonuclease signature motif containing protein n=1 Tax=Streptomyces caniscabiei TaxID=2746961 RepID=A0ABU4N653_9ACTN|nr:HNH endonuclease signature motif containing protein [Streptomyces caniscabiei]MBE4790695.1 HNH endonuclease [Streptomyces caniscabiei]MDX2941012.1 HNH endonuclease signature motif containing protein [Streptomyces caniscabiei]MDX3044796.1 HNH endonuclease signature motif containing protein [Streptomyces caniscabiei]
MTEIAEAALARFWSKVALDPTGCLVWTAARNTDGYGRFCWQGAGIPAHRFGYIALVGEIPAGLSLDHLCRVRHCVRPDHLEAVTPRENTLRGENHVADQVHRTHCPRGHAYTEANTRVKGGKRECRTCHNQARRDKRAARKSA